MPLITNRLPISPTLYLRVQKRVLNKTKKLQQKTKKPTAPKSDITISIKSIRLKLSSRIYFASRYSKYYQKQIRSHLSSPFRYAVNQVHGKIGKSPPHQSDITIAAKSRGMKGKTCMARIIISLEQPDKTWLKQIAKTMNVSMAEIMRRSLKSYRDSLETTIN